MGGVDPDVILLGGDPQAVRGVESLNRHDVANLERLLLTLKEEIKFLFGANHLIKNFIQGTAFHEKNAFVKVLKA